VRCRGIADSIGRAHGVMGDRGMVVGRAHAVLERGSRCVHGEESEDDSLGEGVHDGENEKIGRRKRESWTGGRTERER
jgi:hypothetical protein